MAAGLLTAGIAAAQVATPGAIPAQRLDTVVVEDIPVEQNTLPTAPTTSVYGLGLAPQDTPRTLSQITAAQYLNDNIKNSNDFIYYTPGVTVQGGQTDPVQPLIRGQIGQIYVNGFLAGLSGSANGPAYSPNAVESVDLVAGPASVVYGPSSLTSGYLNYITKQPYFDAFHGYAQADLGSWVSGGSSYANFRQQIDFGAPIVKDQLAYRVSVQKQEADSYYENVHNNYNDVYAAINWVPNKDFEVDYNIEWKTVDQFFSSGWNRPTQDLVSNGTYLDGPAIPIIKLNTPIAIPGGSTTYYSPVLNASGQVTGYRARQLVGNQRYVDTGVAVSQASLPASARGQIVGYVLDPSLTRRVRVYGFQTNTGPDGSGADWEVHQQGRAKLQYNDELTLLNEADLDIGSMKEINAAGTSTLQKDAFFEDRLHAQLHKEYDVAGLDIDHQSDSGLAFRYENTNTDIKTKPTTNAWGDMLVSADANQLLGAQVYPTPASGFSTGGLFGTVPTAYAPQYDTVLYGSYLATPGSAFADWDAQGGLFSQHAVKFGDQWGLNVGGRFDWLYVHVDNPISYPSPVAIAGASSSSVQGGDSSSFVLPSMNSSLTYKPVPWTTTYLTFDYSQAYNGSGTGAFTLNGSNQLSSANFHSDSLLYEAGAKFDLVPGKLLGNVAGFYQERNQYNALTNLSSPLEAHGVDVSLRYQPTKNFSAGVNGEFINAHYTNFAWTSAAIKSGLGVVADNATLFGSSQFTNSGHGSGNYAVPALPTLNGSGYVQYKLDGGLGAQLRAWGTSSWATDISGAIVVPAQYNLDLDLFYERPHWRVDVDVTNLTDARVIESTAGLLQEAPLAIQGRLRYTF